MVSISDSEVNTSPASPAAPSWLALPAKAVRFSSTLWAMPAGIRLPVSHSCSASRSRSNEGKAVKSDSATTASGTSASTVVKVSEPAVTPSRSCAQRRISTRQAASTGEAAGFMKCQASLRGKKKSQRERAARSVMAGHDA